MPAGKKRSGARVGGARPGAGRPPVADPRTQTTIRLPSRALEALGGLVGSTGRSRGDVVAAALLAFGAIDPATRATWLEEVPLNTEKPVKTRAT